MSWVIRAGFGKNYYSASISGLFCTSTAHCVGVQDMMYELHHDVFVEKGLEEGGALDFVLFLFCQFCFSFKGSELQKGIYSLSCNANWNNKFLDILYFLTVTYLVA